MTLPSHSLYIDELISLLLAHLLPVVRIFFLLILGFLVLFGTKVYVSKLVISETFGREG